MILMKYSAYLTGLRSAFKVRSFPGGCIWDPIPGLEFSRPYFGKPGSGARLLHRPC